jgi:hypothetical protein
VDHNPFLRPAASVREGACKGAIERPGSVENIVWQTRASAPTAFENRLGDALERIFADGATELAEIVAKLNASDVRAPEGAAWTEASLAELLGRLGAHAAR